MLRLTKAGVACQASGPSHRARPARNVPARGLSAEANDIQGSRVSITCPSCSPAASRRGARAARCGGCSTADTRSCSASPNARTESAGSIPLIPIARRSSLSVECCLVPGGNDERDASSSRLHSRNALAVEWLVSYVGKRARFRRQQIPRPSKAQESHTADGYRKLATTASGHPNEGARRGPCCPRLRIQCVGPAVAGIGIDDRPNVTLRDRHRRRQSAHRPLHTDAPGRIAVVPIRGALVESSPVAENGVDGGPCVRRKRRPEYRGPLSGPPIDSAGRFAWPSAVAPSAEANARIADTRPMRRKYLIAALHSWRGSSSAPRDEGSIVVQQARDSRDHG